MSYPKLLDVLGNGLNILAWDDMRSPASGINPVGSPSPATVNTTDGSLTFAKGNVATMWVQMPHRWKIGTDIKIHIHWSKTTSAAGIVNWQMKYKWCNVGDVMSAYSSLLTGSEAVPNSDTANKHAIYTWGLVPGAGKELSSMIGIYLTRVNDGIDTYAADVNLYEIDIHYQMDTVGSRQEYVK